MEYSLIQSVSDVIQLARHLPETVSLDTEYSDMDIRKAELLSVSIGVSDNYAYIVEPQLIKYLEPVIRCKMIYFQNFTVDHFMMKKSGVDLSNTPFLDTMLMEHLIDENLDHGLGDMAVRYFGDTYKSEFWSKYENYADAPLEEACEYEMRDACYTYRLGRRFQDELRGKEALLDHVHRLARALNNTENKGVRVDVELVKKTKESMFAEISGYLPRLRSEFLPHVNLYELRKWAEEIGKRTTDAGKKRVDRPEFSFNSDRQLRWLVYDALGRPVVTKTKKGNPSTDYETLETLSKDYSELKTLVEYKGTKTVYSTFVEGMLDRVEGNRVYPRFSVNGTTTGRISHSNPNMGNIPREGVIRNFFLPDDGQVIIGADFSQIEVVIEANLTKDPQLLKIILEGASKHDITATGLGLSRDQAKTLNFALQYGAGFRKVSKLLNISAAAAQEVFNQYWRLYSGVKALKDETAQKLKKDKAVTNIFGRTRHFSPAENEFDSAKQERQAYNFLIQGPAGDICNRAFYLYSEDLKKRGVGRTLWPVHDEVLASVNPLLAEGEKENLVNIMESISTEMGFEFPLKAKSYGPLKYWSKT